MAPQSGITRFAAHVGAPDSPGVASGAWWPRTRCLAEQLADLFASWPRDQPRINRVLYSPPDWDDRPRKVPVAGRWVKTGNFPGDDTRSVVLSLSDGTRRTIMVIPSTCEVAEAQRVLKLFDHDSAQDC